MVIISSVKTQQQMQNLVSKKYDTKNSFPTKYSWTTKGRRVTLPLEKPGKHPLNQEITVTITRQRTNHTAPPEGWNESIFLLWYSCRRCILNLLINPKSKTFYKMQSSKVSVLKIKGRLRNSSRLKNTREIWKLMQCMILDWTLLVGRTVWG